MNRTVQSDVGQLQEVVLKHARDAFVNEARVAEQWRTLHYPAAPDLVRAVDEYDQFVERLRGFGVEIRFLPSSDKVGLDSIYVRDSSVVCDEGLILCNMGKPERRTEPAQLAAQTECFGLPVLGTIEPPGQLEGGDLIWLDSRTPAVGLGYRTNTEGIEQLGSLLGDRVDGIVVVPLPHWRGPDDVMHLMSVISPLDYDLALVYSPLMPVTFRQLLLERGIELIEVPEAEYDSLGCNVLATGPRRCLAVEGNPETRRRMEAAGVEVCTYSGKEISLKGAGGPTCLTRPLFRKI